MMSASESEKPPKRLKISIFDPFVSSGPVAASRSSALEETEYLAKVRLDDVESDTEFFPENITRENPDTIPIGRGVQYALKFTWYNQDRFRNAVYWELKSNHGIKFPDSSAQTGPFRHRKYKETNLANLLKERYGGEDSMPRLLHGLNVTTTSMPDMAVLRDGYLYFGEFKNSKHYTDENAARQCTLYLYSLLYCFRVRLGLDVKAVFGFWVCGPNCHPESDEYSIGYIRLAAPENLGGSLRAQTFSNDFKTDSVAGLQQLIYFLKFGKIVEQEDTAPHGGHRIPAFLSLPKKLWNSKLLVPNGTTSMVFKGTGDELLGLLEKVHITAGGTSRFDSFLLDAKEAFSNGGDSIYYLKIRLRDTTFRDNPIYTASTIFTQYKDVFKKIYPMEMFPIEPWGNANTGIFIMNNCGISLNQSEEFKKLSFSAFCECFAKLWEDMSSMKLVLLHGDALPHNMVYNENIQKIMIIDIDEGTIGSNAHNRVIEESDQNLYAYLRYPNFFRIWLNRDYYTDLQLSVSFLLLAEMFVEKMEEEDKGLIVHLQDLAEEANSFLKHLKKKSPLKRTAKVDERVSRLIESMTEFLSNRSKTDI